MPKILTIDDIEDNLIIQSVILTRYIPDCTVITATSGLDGIEKAIKELPDTILLDIMMPGLDGFEVCRRLKCIDETRSIPVIMLTGVRMDTRNRVKGLDVGADAFLTKPVEAIELVAQVNVMLRIKHAEAELRQEKEHLEQVVRKRTRALQTLSHCSRALVHSESELEFVQDICRIVVEQGQYRMAWVGFSDDDNDKTVHSIAYWGDRDWYQSLTKVKLTWDDAGIGMGPVGSAIRTGKPCVVHDLKNDPFYQQWRADALNKGCASVIALPLMNGDNAIGVLNIIAEETGVFVDTEYDLLMELADDLAYGIMMFRLQVEREAAQAALKNSEEQYRSLFNGVPVGIYRASTDGKVIDANPTLYHILGSTDQGALQSINFIKTYLTEEEAGRLFAEVRDTGKVDNFETRIITFAGNEIWISLKLQAVYDNQKKRILYVEGAVEDITHRKRSEEHIHTLTQELIKAQESERQRIARDLHDHVAQNLGALKITCNTLIMNQLDNPELMKKSIINFSEVLSESISSVRDIAYNLRPPNLDQMGLIRTIAQYCDDFSDRSNMMVDFYSAGMEHVNLDFDMEINLYRLIQEALNNIRKHSEARNVMIRIVASSPDIIVRIEDDGKGFEVEKRMFDAFQEKRMGLKSMEERVSLLGGSMSIKSRLNEGTKIVIKVKNINPDAVMNAFEGIREIDFG
ncbi:MAG: response regulator [Proteobacteria bacterium]|nr:response regulator [Pseudomonadota bacterium]